MKYLVSAAGLLAFGASGAIAGGVDRSGQSVSIIFEPGNYVEFSYGNVNPEVSGTQLLPLGPFGAVGESSGDMTGDYETFSLGVKVALDDRLDLAFILDQPIGANVNYPASANYAYAGSTATLDNSAVSAVLRYKINDNFSVLGGARISSMSGQVALFNGYTLDAAHDTAYGYILGAAYERPDIALRVALTYNSAITHEFQTTEFGAPSSPFETTIPQSVNLDFQSGIAADTLIFGSVRWVDWTEFDISPVAYVGLVGDPLVSYDSDRTTYTIGIGRKFNDTWSGAFSLGYEAQNNDLTGNLGPTDGIKMAGLGVTYTRDAMKISAGVRYFEIGDAQSKAPAPYPPGTAFGDFKNNSGYAFGIKVGFGF
ncbi:MAG: outer membrane protein transport protein [Paracoccaceae bacterium]